MTYGIKPTALLSRGPIHTSSERKVTPSSLSYEFISRKRIKFAAAAKVKRVITGAVKAPEVESMRLTYIRSVPLSTVILSWYFCLDEVLNFNVLSSEILAVCRIHFAVASPWYYYVKQLVSVLYGVEVFAGSQFTSFASVLNGESVIDSLQIKHINTF